jgi:hypothetical protein
MKRRMLDFSTGSRRLFLGLAIVLCLVLLVVLVVHEVGPRKRSVPESFRFIRLKHSTLILEKADPWVGKELKVIEDFEKVMDSLEKDVHGKRIFDSIVRARPGLLDSARRARGYYSGQLKK